MQYTDGELSIDNGEPIELYLFKYANIIYTFTSSQYTQQVTIDDIKYVFSPEFIKRSDSLRLGNEKNTVEACIITVLRNNSIALLYQGAPPEEDSVSVKVYRMHGEDSEDIITLVDGTVSQVAFSESQAELTITVENVLSRNVPRGTLSYFCQNCVYDDKCTLDEKDWEESLQLDSFVGLNITCADLANKEDDYYTNGYIRMGNTFRQVSKHKGSTITIKYPIPNYARSPNFRIYPGCDGNFSICARRFGNTDHFSGVPYIQPYDPFLHPVNKGAYWVDGNIVYRDTDGFLNTMPSLV